MFIYNLKLNKRIVSKTFIIISLIIIISIIAFGIYIIFFKHNPNNTCAPDSNEILELNETNYTDILKASNENIESYIGCKVRVTGYVYRLIDFDEDQFVIARDMRFKDTPNSLVVGFLCNFKNAKKYPDGTWVEIVGKIKKGEFNGDIALLDVISIKETNAPENIYVNPPDKTYIPETY